MEPTKAPLKGKNGRTYPYVVRTDMTVIPHEQSNTRYGNFMSLPNSSMGTRLWGFEEEDGASLFWLDHKDRLVEY